MVTVGLELGRRGWDCGGGVSVEGGYVGFMRRIFFQAAQIVEVPVGSGRI